ncbi:hypothetical protein TPHA_0C04490 [Tetrapisispora phaffii CBS 4417]|uniref:Protein FAF1 n=1 Tax=Tetrapisispora phaffii (strain ATCC 24235 / CBS 4417 / NBRC 1672 / NRRL Y-8282 / UCD 70-5) TaxID=1071381 RepID=G8BQT8_TETPH|nr:hypothetical protein TPHA_0C04490 [Tetrapisispora phaffii CBS 4417]CCE62600.1 hypothetical protein TPHA_0C04490 [Tetrapisispora phaffii CBS 4417]
MGGSGDEGDYARALEAQRRAFEAQFGSLESMGFDDKTKNIEEEGSGSESDLGNSESDNDLSDESVDSELELESESEAGVEVESVKKEVVRKGPKVIKFQESFRDGQFITPSKKEQKLVRSGKTLTQVKKTELKHAMEELDKNEDSDENEELEKENLENDLQLQQFLRESHLLSSLNSGSSTTEAGSGARQTLQNMDSTHSKDITFQDDMLTGKARARTLEMRLNRLSKINGNAHKIGKLEKVPMQIRKGMVKSHVTKINRFEQEAKDGGIVLAKVKKGQFRKIDATYKKDIERRIGTSIKTKDRQRNSMRKRGLKIQSVGRSTRNGLVISKQEIARINGTDKPKQKHKKGRR